MLLSTSEAARPIDRYRLAGVAAQIGVEFPETYKQFLLTYNGGRPTPASFTAVVDGIPRWMRVHFFFGIDDDMEACDLLWNHRVMTGRLPHKVVPIADDEFGNLFCLDLRSGGLAQILLWDHEQEGGGNEAALKVAIARSFEDWLNQLTIHA